MHFEEYPTQTSAEHECHVHCAFRKHVRPAVDRAITTAMVLITLCFAYMTGPMEQIAVFTWVFNALDLGVKMGCIWDRAYPSYSAIEVDVVDIEVEDGAVNVEVDLEDDDGVVDLVTLRILNAKSATSFFQASKRGPGTAPDDEKDQESRKLKRRIKKLTPIVAKFMTTICLTRLTPAELVLLSPKTPDDSLARVLKAVCDWALMAVGKALCYSNEDIVYALTEKAKNKVINCQCLAVKAADKGKASNKMVHDLRRDNKYAPARATLCYGSQTQQAKPPSPNAKVIKHKTTPLTLIFKESICSDSPDKMQLCNEPAIVDKEGTDMSSCTTEAVSEAVSKPASTTATLAAYCEMMWRNEMIAGPKPDVDKEPVSCTTSTGGKAKATRAKPKALKAKASAKKENMLLLVAMASQVRSHINTRGKGTTKEARAYAATTVAAAAAAGMAFLILMPKGLFKLLYSPALHGEVKGKVPDYKEIYKEKTALVTYDGFNRLSTISGAMAAVRGFAKDPIVGWTNTFKQTAAFGFTEESLNARAFF
ncbi:hypothetical protein BDK51DRAFT_42522 [Blyttiomyces helicus]|uniref:Uncharacterized protein n=1 Tax=Blyttiomyces helicus TaxID=388810 RepID=A0A4P9W408_9FUNG|nr:hypothetical protein BDK51DRAFT_42522 [Blyttiomyces helicus]|eukprot:RKO87069.1 hypothetical protein BDK51DRAFT_42522 [Blyttiomyces helicus]